MRNMSGLLLTCVVALVCGFLGAVVAVTVLQDQLAGPQGPTGLQGLRGEPGPAGTDGLDGEDGAAGERGPRGRAGKAPEADDTPVNVGTQNCLGRSVRVVTDVTVRNDQMQLERDTVCLVE